MLVTAVLTSLREHFFWIDQHDDVRAFVSSCLLCVLAKSGNKVPGLLSTTLHAKKPNEIIHFDCLFLGESDGDSRYVLVVKDDLSGYCRLEPTTQTLRTPPKSSPAGREYSRSLMCGYLTKARTSRTQSWSSSPSNTVSATTFPSPTPLGPTAPWSPSCALYFQRAAQCCLSSNLGRKTGLCHSRHRLCAE